MALVCAECKCAREECAKGVKDVTADTILAICDIYQNIGIKL
jgi:hypothetical protein